MRSSNSDTAKLRYLPVSCLISKSLDKYQSMMMICTQDKQNIFMMEEFKASLSFGMYTYFSIEEQSGDINNLIKNDQGFRVFPKQC